MGQGMRGGPDPPVVILINVLFDQEQDHFERRARFRGVQSRRTAAHSPLYISPKQPDHKSVCLFLLTLYKQEWLLNPLCTPRQLRARKVVFFPTFDSAARLG
jgi:hypothetical protein